MTNGKKPIEAFALSRVPREQRKSWVDMVMVQAGMVICIPAFLLGSMLAEGMPTLQAMVAGVIGYGMVLVLTLILGIQGADLGIPTCAISTSTFGRKGTRLLVSSLFTVSLECFVPNGPKRINFVVCARHKIISAFERKRKGYHN